MIGPPAFLIAFSMSAVASATIYDGVKGRTISKTSWEFIMAIVMLVLGTFGAFVLPR
jgi:hypothetical protein